MDTDEQPASESPVTMVQLTESMVPKKRRRPANGKMKTIPTQHTSATPQGPHRQHEVRLTTHRVSAADNGRRVQRRVEHEVREGSGSQQASAEVAAMEEEGDMSVDSIRAELPDVEGENGDTPQRGGNNRAAVSTSLGHYRSR